MPDPIFRPDSNEEWEALLRQLRRPQAQPKPFFYARVQGRLLGSDNPATSWLLPWLRRPAYAAVLGALVLTVSGDGAVAATTRSPGSSYLVRPVPGSR